MANNKSQSLIKSEYTHPKFAVRFAAYFTDSLIFAMTIGLLVTSLYKNPNYLKNINTALFFLYFTVGTALYGTSLGKKLFNLEVITTNGEKPDWIIALLREFLGKFISTVVFMIGFLWSIKDKNKQTWHDKIAKTYVIETKPLAKWQRITAYFIYYFFIVFIVLALISFVKLANITGAN